ncbi:undecaprenyl-phosphate galactose phosphotransferase WbaP [Aeromonas veronii]|uniref:undecaprenyl-phosphate galactose phosphotransferase WbaP n=1 Tax=Aeromonas veronii TaxID=654 RepID=UPI000AE5F63F|nr:undecaprenyl-phosphate galactose phosphotransferase WbaP [Aeromonas veronii]MCJ8233324.1 undecaprenyl-phosphate galactose phosphotransferase WbaP [Aeromonas veronii]PSJ92039.1 UDP-phosphate galactose phosphotransferase [Aeromonas veronii]
MVINFNGDKQALFDEVYRPKIFFSKIALAIGDLTALFIAFVLSWFLESIRVDVDLTYVFTSGSDSARVWSFSVYALLIMLLSWGFFRHYTYRKSFWSELKETLLMLLFISMLDLAVVAISKWDFSRYQWMFFWSSVIFIFPFLRWVVKKSLIKLKCWQMPSVIIGCGENAREAFLAINTEKLLGFQIIAFISPDQSNLVSPVSTIPIISENVQGLTEKFAFCKIFIALEYEQSHLRDEWIRYLSSHGMRNVSVIPAMRGVPLYGTDVSHFFSHELMMLRVNNNLARLSSRIIKRLFDILVSSILLCLLSPFLLYIGWKVSRDGASPLYGHERVGQYGRKFKCLKFRSMIINSKEVLEHLLSTDANAKAEWDKDFKLKNDPRITSVGHFLRKTSLDELPQLFNVLRGEMSLVGPRPVVEEELERYGDDKSYYLMAKPGMTGLWQVSGRNDVDYSTRVYFDSWYVKNWGLWNDIAILFKTVSVVFNREGAY